MQQHKIVEDYLSSIIPDKIADSTKTELRAEIESHIYDKAEFYMEIGYDEEIELHLDILSVCDQFLITSEISEGVRRELEFARLIELEVFDLAEKYREI